MFCLLPEKINEFRKALKEKEITIPELLNLSTEARTKLLEKYAGDNAKAVNTLFEEKLVLKNRVLGIKNWASKVGEIGRYDPAKKEQLAQLASEYRAKQQERIFSPAEDQAFLNDLADETLGVHITREEAQGVFDLTKKVDEAKAKMESVPRRTDATPTPQEREYGATKVALKNYTDILKGTDDSIKTMLEQVRQDFKETFKENPPKAVGELFLKTVKTISDNSIGLVATGDLSFLGRQGLHTLETHPTVWWNGAKNAFTDFGKTIGGKNMQDALLADLYSDPYYADYKKAKLIPDFEEQYPTALPSRIPGVGRVFTASDTAFTNAAIRMRTGVYRLLAEHAKRNGVDITDPKWIENQGKLIGSLTARGTWGRSGDSALKMVMWAPKMLKGNYDVLTAHTGTAFLDTPFAKKQAVLNWMKVVGTSAAIMTLANAIKPGSAETDSNSSDFGKIRWTDEKGFKHTIDYTAGAASLVTLASRLITNSSKSVSTGITKPLGSGFGQQSRLDVLLNFLEGKTTPPIGALISILKGVDPTGQKATVANQIPRIVTPITAQNSLQLKDDATISQLIGVIVDTLGLNSNTYKPTDTDWTQNPGVELQAFQKTVGDAKFQQANDKYNKEFADWLVNVKKDPHYIALAEADKQKIITSRKAKLKTEVFLQYGFRYKKAVSKPLPKL